MPELSREWVYFSLVNGVPAALAAILFLVYPRFDRHFAWDVGPRQSGIFLGTGFILRASLFAHIIRASSWGEIRWLVWGNVVYAAVLLLVTMVWGDMFRWRRPIAVIWLFLYIEEPVWLLTLVPDARAAWAGAPPLPGGEINPPLQIVLWGQAAIMLVAGLYLFFRAHKDSDPLWPWRPNPMSARMMAGWPLAWAAWAPTLARAESWGEARAGVLLNIIWLAAVLASLVVFQSHFDLSRRPTRIYAAVIAVLLVLLVVFFFLQS